MKCFHIMYYHSSRKACSLPFNSRDDSDRYIYTEVSRTLCPVGSFQYQFHDALLSKMSETQRLSIDVSTQSNTELQFDTKVEFFPNFDLTWVYSVTY